MLQRAIALALTMAFVLLSPGAVRAQATQADSRWQRTDSQHFEIQYLPALAPKLDRVVRSAERAYDRIAGRLNFVLPTKVALVVFIPSGSRRQNRLERPQAATESHRQPHIEATCCSQSLKAMHSSTR
jgi:hypothetical protein